MTLLAVMAVAWSVTALVVVVIAGIARTVANKQKGRHR